jgi:periplasmic mercuric ion binding protein
MNQLTAWVVLFLFVLVAITAFAATSTVALTVEGMTWGTWPIAVKKALEGLKGVSRAEVSFRDKEARVTFDQAQVTVEQLIDAVNRAGFRAALKARGTN